MTKKHFKAIAAAFKNIKPNRDDLSDPSSYEGRYYQWTVDVSAMADVCSVSNPEFNRYKFLKACNFERGE